MLASGGDLGLVGSREYKAAKGDGSLVEAPVGAPVATPSTAGGREASDVGGVVGAVRDDPSVNSELDLLDLSATAAKRDAGSVPSPTKARSARILVSRHTRQTPSMDLSLTNVQRMICCQSKSTAKFFSGRFSVLSDKVGCRYGY